MWAHLNRGRAMSRHPNRARSRGASRLRRDTLTAGGGPPVARSPRRSRPASPGARGRSPREGRPHRGDHGLVQLSKPRVGRDPSSIRPGPRAGDHAGVRLPCLLDPCVRGGPQLVGHDAEQPVLADLPLVLGSREEQRTPRTVDMACAVRDSRPRSAQDVVGAAHFHECAHGVLEVLGLVRGADLHADAGLALGHDGVARSR